MEFDLHGALVKKQEHESARLDDFAFRLRARTARLLAEALDLDANQLVAAIATMDDAGLMAACASSRPKADVVAQFATARATARAELVRERGDPAPYRLA